MNVLNKFLALFVLSVSLSSVTAFADESELQDPWEGFNRGVFNFNESLDRAILKPVAQGYRFIMPDVAEQGVSNFFDNLRDVVTFFNNVLQLKPVEATQDLSRVLINTTIGIGGLFDVATAMDIPKNDEDFGQTLGAWGVESGPYLVLPLFGPSTVRDGVGIIPDMYLDPLNQVESDELRFGLKALKVVDKRASLLDREGVITGDRYTFIRDAYLQKREFEVNDGRVEFNADDF
ncbi:MAG: putative phospholipid-binding lipoprotein MlaA [Marinobacterium sp. xm-d-530]|nr:MAG: putative phospholipid-binding lipoprotein MlaA [Marinobacterium sp. xm-d-530]